MEARRISVPQDAIAAWCAATLGSEPARTVFEAGHLSHVAGLRLADGREAVVKVRPAEARIAGCVEAQRRLWASGFPCPEPLVGPSPLGALTATAEAYVPGGVQLDPGPDSPRLFAEALADLVRSAPAVAELPTLDPPPPWAWWDHDQPGDWPLPDDLDVDLNAHPGPAWLDDLARRLRARLARDREPLVVGHVDWESQNIRWIGRRLHVAHDWDSVASLPEAAIAGLSSAVYPAGYAPGTTATIEQSEAFIAAYERARGRPWSRDEREICWAAGLWERAFNAKKASLEPSGADWVARLEAEYPARMRLAGA